MMKKFLKIFVIVFTIIFAFVGITMVGGFLFVKYGWSDVDGQVDSESHIYTHLEEDKNILIEPIIDNKPIIDAKYYSIKEIDILLDYLSEVKLQKSSNYCKMVALSRFADYNANNIFHVYQDVKSENLLTKMFLAVNMRLSENEDYNEMISVCGDAQNFTVDDVVSSIGKIENENIFDWQNTEQWEIISKGIIVDKQIIDQVSSLVGIQSRILVSTAIVEQLRLFYTQRELYEKYFKPLSILASANKMAWGIMSIKENTAIAIEDHLKDKNSEYYLGEEFENILDFKTDNHSNERYNRLASEDHYYSYLYGAIYLKQLIAQWENFGVDIKYRPEIVATLFNIGFQNSFPNNNPQVGGSELTINNKKYSFGSLAFEYYCSGEDSDMFPYN